MTGVNYPRSPLPVNFYPDSFFTTTKPRNVTLPIQSLCKAYWLSKSYDISISINWETKDISGASLSVGSISGSGTFNVIAGIPSSRTALQPNGASQPSSSGDHPTLAWAISGSVINASGTDYLGGLSWFEEFIQSPLVACVTKDAMGNYLTRGDTNILSNPQTPFLGPAIVFQVDTSSAPPSASTAIAFDITVDGVICPTIPINAIINDGGASIVATGTINFNFNNFWT